MIHTLNDILAKEGLKSENGYVPASLAAKALMKKESMISECLHQMERALTLSQDDKRASKTALEIKSDIMATIEFMKQQMKSEHVEATERTGAKVVSIHSVKKIA